MSGICGIFSLDGQPIDRPLLETMTTFLTFRGPDAREIWCDRAIGFGHTLLQTTTESMAEQQPCTLDGQVYITADARIDARDELIPVLQAQGRSVQSSDPDVNLILHAYHLWGKDCLQHLIGDFAFALWDPRQHRLFCARDPCGVKLFYWAKIGQTVIFSNTLNCLRLHPQSCNQLNEQVIGDFLLFDLNFESNTTIFAEINSLPGGYELTVAEGEVRSQSYWTLPMPTQLRYRHTQDYIEHFQEVMELAVADRLRTENVSIFFSGGLDSTTIAATALEVARKRDRALNLHAVTVVYDRLIRDHERYYAGLAAETLNIPLHYIIADNYPLYQGWDRPELQFPEPLNSPLVLVTWDKLQHVAAYSRVALYGQGGDEALRTATVREMLQGMPLDHVVSDLVHCLFQHHLKPSLGTGLLGRLRSISRNQPSGSALPAWLNPDFVQRLNLVERWQQIRGQPLPLDYPPRSLSYHGLPPSPAWHLLFAFHDPGYLGIPVEVRLPFLDLRLLNYLLALPPLPWCVSKELLRVALRGKLPQSICQRPKSPIAVDPVGVLANAHPRPWYDRAICSKLESYVALPIWKELTSSPMNSRQAWPSLRPVSLNYWLQQFD